MTGLEHGNSCSVKCFCGLIGGLAPFFLSPFFLLFSLFSLSSTRLETGEKKLSFKTALPVVAKILWRLMAGGNLWRLVAARIHVLRSLLYKRRKRPSQPRACKLRKQRFPYLTAPRGEYIEIPHIKKYRKGA